MIVEVLDKDGKRITHFECQSERKCNKCCFRFKCFTCRSGIEVDIHELDVEATKYVKDDIYQSLVRCRPDVSEFYQRLFREIIIGCLRVA